MGDTGDCRAHLKSTNVRGEVFGMTASQLRTLLKLRPVLYVIALALGFIFLHAPGPRSVLLVVALVIGLRSSLVLLTRFVPWSQNPSTKNLVTGFAWVVGSMYYLGTGKSSWGLAFAIIALVAGILGTINGLQWVLLDGLVFGSVLGAFRRRRPIVHGGVPIIYVLTEPGVDDRFISRLTGKATQALWKYRLVNGAESLHEHLRSVPLVLLRKIKSKNRSRAVFIYSRALSSRSPIFRFWLAANAGCVVIIRWPLGSDPKSEKAFVTEMKEHCLRARGPVIGLALTFPRSNRQPDYKSLGNSVECFSVNLGHLNEGPSDFVAPLVERLASTVVPAAMSDAALPDNLQPLITKIGRSGIPPIADCYLRYRLSRSHVERFLALMDGFECLAKTSVLCRVALAPERSSSIVRLLEGRKLALSKWVECLQKVAATSEPLPPLDAIYKFWNTDFSDSQRWISDKVAKNKPWNVPRLVGTRQIEWIRWINDLRNATKGHGVVSDESVRDLWHPLHEAFLYMVWGLAKFAISSQYVVASGGTLTSLHGWRRDIANAQNENPQVDALLSAEVYCQGRIAGALGKFVLVRRTSVFVWDGLSDDKDDPKETYLDYLTGERLELGSAERYALQRRGLNLPASLS